MRLILWLKIVLLIGFIYFSLRVIFIDYPIEQSIKAQQTVLSKLRKDRALDTSEGRERYLQKRLVIQKQIDNLHKKKHPNWYQYIPIILSPIAGWLIRGIIFTVFKKRANNNQSSKHS
jgi:hypothetical protein